MYIILNCFFSPFPNPCGCVCTCVCSQRINVSQRYNNGLKFMDLTSLQKAEGELCRLRFLCISGEKKDLEISSGVTFHFPWKSRKLRNVFSLESCMLPSDKKREVGAFYLNSFPITLNSK